MQGIWISQSQKRTRDYCFDMENEKTPRMEEIESGQHKIQQKTAQMTKMVTNLTKGKWITDDPCLQRKPTSWKGNMDPFIVPSPNNHGEHEELRKNRSGQSEHVNVQQKCDLLDKKLKEIEGVNDLGSVDLENYAWSLIWSCRPSSKCRNLKSTMEPNALRTIWPRIVTRWRGTLVMKIC